MARLALAALALASALALAAPAQAEVFYVDDGAGSSTACTASAKCNLISEGLTRARATPEADTIVVDPGLYTQTVDLTNVADAGLTVQGAGAGEGAFDPGTQTIVRATSSSGNAQLRTNQNDVTVRNLRVDVPPTFARPGLDLLGDRNRAENVTVELREPTSAALGINAATGKTGTVLDRVRVFTPAPSRGVLANGTNMVVADSRIASGQQALEVGGSGLYLARSHLSRASAGAVLFALADGLVVDSSLLTGGGAGVELFAADATNRTATLRGVTIDAGDPKLSDPGLVALRARADAGPGTTGSAIINALDSILVEPQVSEGAGVGQVLCTATDAPSQDDASGLDRVACASGVAGNSFTPAGALFAPGSDWHLVPGSPAADSGSEAPLAAGESGVDLDRNARVADGNRDCAARRDKGAYELGGQAAPCPPANPAPAFRRAWLSHKRFRAAGAGNARRPRGSARKPAPVGTTFRWRLSEAARVTITISRRGKRLGRLSLRARAGQGSKRFEGRLKRKALAPGPYRAVLVARDETGQASAPKRIGFKIVAR